jgi:hypothetical protein
MCHLHRILHFYNNNSEFWFLSFLEYKGKIYTYLINPIKQSPA